MKVTAILCTYNRSQMLTKALDSVAASQVPPSVDWEVLVVDNNSNDRTPEVIFEFARRYPGRFRYLMECRQGKSFALNTGIQEARGEILAFMDDDATVDPLWLHNLTAPLNDRGWAGVGGRIILQWPDTLPNWLSAEGSRSRHVFPGFDKGDEPQELVGPPFGANMAFRREMFEKHGGFRTDLGPEAGSEIRGEDTEFGRRLIAAGERLCYEPSAVVYHPVPADRINKKHFLRWWFDNGRASTREFDTPYVRELASLAAWVSRWITTVDRRKRFFCKLVVWEKSGRLAEAMRSKPKARGFASGSPRK